MEGRMPRCRPPVFLACVSLVSVLLSGLFTLPVRGAVPEAVLVSNIQTYTRNISPLYLQGIVTAGDRAFRLHSDLEHGKELWVSDEIGTRRVKDITPGPAGSEISTMLAAGQNLFFTVDNEGKVLWVTDGTEAGTRKLPFGRITGLMRFGDRILISGHVRSRYGLWICDGTPESLVCLMETHMTLSATTPVMAAGVQYFVGQEESTGYELWKTDGTAKGTALVKDIEPGPESSSPGDLTAAGARISFVATSRKSGTKLWITDGTAKGTVILKNFNLSSELTPRIQQPIVGAGGQQFFPATLTGVGYDLWKTDGTVAGTAMIKDLPDVARIQFMTAVGDQVCFLERYQSPVNFWLSDGTGAGTRILNKDPIHHLDFQQTLAIGQTLYFSYKRRIVDSWVVKNVFYGVSKISIPDGIITQLYEKEVPQNHWSTDSIGTLVRVGQRVLFNPKVSGRRTLWGLDGTVAGTVEIMPDSTLTGLDIVAGTSRAFYSVTAGDTVQLWSTDGTYEGRRQDFASLVRDGDSNPADLRAIDDKIYFSANDLSDQKAAPKLWRTNGTAKGTGPAYSANSPTPVQKLAGKIWFTSITAASGRELWVTDAQGTPSRMVKDIYPGATGSEPEDFMEMNGLLYFSANGGDGRELWRSDGTVNGTRKVKDISTAASGSTPDLMTVFGGNLYFTASHPASGTELWVTDGTDAGTSLFKDLTPGTAGSFPRHFTSMGGLLYFFADGRLFQTDGTAANTFPRVQNLTGAGLVTLRPPTPGAVVKPEESLLYFAAGDRGHLYQCTQDGEVSVVVEQRVTHLYPAGPQLLLICQDSSHNSTLWQSDGTPSGLTRFLPETENVSAPLSLTGDRIYYRQQPVPNSIITLKSVRRDGTGIEHLGSIDAKATLHVEGNTLFFWRQFNYELTQLWRTQGTPDTTQAVPRAFTTYSSTSPVAKLGSKLYFSAYSVSAGHELHSLDLGGYVRLSIPADDPEGLDSSIISLKEDATLSFQPQLLQQSRVRTLRLSNAGDQPLTGVTFSSPALADFTLSPAEIGTIAPGNAVEVHITFTPQAAGLRQTSVQLNGTGSAAFTQTLHLTGRGYTAGEAPEFWHQPRSALVLAGQPVTFTTAVNAPLPATTFHWRKDGGPPLSASAPGLTLPAVKETDAGAYALTVMHPGGATATSASACLGVITPAPGSIPQLLAGRPLKLTCTVNAPPGCQISYEWFINGSPASYVKGAVSPVLQIPGVDSDSDYECRVTLTAPDSQITVSHGITHVDVLEKPEIIGDLHPNGGTYVGEEVHLQVETSSPAARFSFRGLPPGLKGNPATGLITGRPTRALPSDPETGYTTAYLVYITAYNAAGAGETSLDEWPVYPLMEAGTYEALIARNGNFDNGLALGHRLVLTSTSGSYSGQINVAGQVLRFVSSRADTSRLFGQGKLIFHLTPASPCPPLTLEISTEGEVTLIGPENITEQTLLLRVMDSPWQETGSYYTASFSGGSAGSPEGCSYLTISRSKSFIMNWKGKLADGTAITGSSAILNSRSNTCFYIHHLLYARTGSLHGTIEINSDYGSDSSFLIGDLGWNKAPQPATSKDRAYKDGFDELLSLSGRTYNRQSKVPFFDLVQNGQDNMTAEILSSELALDFDQIDFRISDTYKVLSPGAPDAPMIKSLSLSRPTGLFKGTLLIPHADTRLNRTVPFEGCMVDEGSYFDVRGFFLFPALPVAGPPSTTLKTSPLHSGSIDLWQSQ